MEEQNSLVLKELRAKTHDYKLLKSEHAESQRAVQLLQTALQEQQNMLAERGLVLMGGGEEGEEEEVEEEEQERRTRAIVSQETANILSGLGRPFAEEKVSLDTWFGSCPSYTNGPLIRQIKWPTRLVFVAFQFICISPWSILRI